MGNVVELATVPDQPGASSLDDLAREINVRLQKADDHRLSAALRLAEAKELCAEQNITFKAWVSEHIKFIGYPEATKLAKIGGSDDPAKALEDHRTKGRQTSASAPSKKPVAYVGNSEAAPSGAIVIDIQDTSHEAKCRRLAQALDLIRNLPEPERMAQMLSKSDQSILVDERLYDVTSWLIQLGKNRSE